jgi:hypothetical protein
MELLNLIGYAIGWIVATRLIHIGMVRSADPGEQIGVLLPAFLGILWPIMLGAIIIASPFALVGWLASLGVKSPR